MNTWLALDTGFLCWWHFHGPARKDPDAAVGMALAEADNLCAHFQVPRRRAAFLFDRGPYFRASIIPGYKATRNAQERPPEEVEARKELRARMDALAVRLRQEKKHPVLESAGYEADDHAAKLRECIPRTDRLIVCSADKDLHQLVSTRTDFFDPMRRNLYTLADFRAEWNLHPSDWPQVKAIAGCSSDDVPGVKGVGEKTAARFLTGQLNGMHKSHLAIREFLKTPQYHTNLLACTLPYAGCPAPIFLEPTHGRRPEPAHQS